MCLDANLGHREYFRDLFMKHLEQENRFRKLNKDIFDHMKDESKTREKTIPQIKQQKKKIMASLSPYKGIKSTDVARVEDQDIQNFLSNKERTQNISQHKLVGKEELNRMKRLNYGDYYLMPRYFNRKVKKLEQDVAHVDPEFTRT